MKQKHDWYIFSGILGVVIIWAAMVVAMHQAGVGLIDSRPLSYLGINPSTARLFSVGLLLSSLMFIVFALHVSKKLKVHNHFLIYFIIGQAGQIIAAITPYGMRSNYRLVHTIAAFMLAFSLPFLIREFYKSQTGKKHHAVYRQLYILELATFIIGMGIFTMTKGIAPIGEALPAIGFHAWIIGVTMLNM